MGNDTSQYPEDYDPNDNINETEFNLNPMLYPNFGNYFNLNKINTIDDDITNIAKLTIEEQMKYSDAITRRYAKNPIFIDDQYPKNILAEIKSANKKQFNTTSIGNLAFMSYHNPDNENIKACYLAILAHFSNEQ